MDVSRVWRLLGLLSLLAASVADAAAAGDALLIGSDGPDPGSRGPGCAQTVAVVANRLEQIGVTVHSLVNPSPTRLRDALDAFADEVGGAHSGTTLIYVCALAIAKESRLFIMPAGTDNGAADAQTQGIVLQAPLNALAGTNGTLYADLLVNGDAKDGHVPRLPNGLHLALSEEAEGQAPVIGTALSATGFPFDRDWTAIVDAFRPTGIGLIMMPAPASPAPALDPPLSEPPASAPASPAETQERPPPATVPAKSASGHETSGKTGSALSASQNNTGSGRPRPVVVMPKPDLPVSSRTARIEAALTRRGSYAGPIDGKYTPAVIEAVRNFQRQLGNPLSGFLTQAEIVRLLNS